MDDLSPAAYYEARGEAGEEENAHETKPAWHSTLGALVKYQGSLSAVR